MKRLLILGITIATFAFILYLIGCGGPVANNNNSGNIAEKPVAPNITLDDACTNPSIGGLKGAIVDKIVHGKLKNHYNPANPGQGSIRILVYPDKDGFALLLEGTLGHPALQEFRGMMESFAKKTCISKVIMVPLGTIPLNKSSDEEAVKSLNLAAITDNFTWDLVCEDPSHACPGGVCKDANQACKKGDESPSPTPSVSPNSSLSRNTNTSGSTNR